MEMVKVESSNIDSIGYLPEVSLMRVLFKDGRKYDYLNTSTDAYAGLMASKSKGKHLALHFPSGVLSLADGGEIKLKEPYLVGERILAETRLIETFGEDDCCSARLAKAKPAGDAWTCPKCGTAWVARRIDNMKAWFPDESIAIW